MIHHDAVLSADVITRDEDNFLYVSYSGENTFGHVWSELPPSA